MNLNNDSGVNKYTTQYIKAATATLSANTSTATQAIILDAVSAGYSGSIQIQINQDPATGWKTFHTEGGTQAYTYNTSGAYDSAAEISRIKLEAGAGTFNAGSSMLVYGVR